MYYLRLFVSLLVSVIVLMFIPWDDVKVFSRDHQLIASYLVLAGLLIYVDRVVNAIRWFILIDHRGTRLRFFQILGIYFKSTFLGLVAPSGAGGSSSKATGLSSRESGLPSRFLPCLWKEFWVLSRWLALACAVLPCFIKN